MSDGDGDPSESPQQGTTAIHRLGRRPLQYRYYTSLRASRGEAFCAPKKTWKVTAYLVATARDRMVQLQQASVRERGADQ
jgi:hypothetical protein